MSEDSQKDQVPEDAPRRITYRPVDQEELRRRLQFHSEWLGLDPENQEEQIHKILHLVYCDLENVDLFSSQDLSKAHLAQAKLQGAMLRGVNLREANLKGADLRGASLVQANLEGAKLDEAVLDGADLEGADLSFAILQGVTGLKPGQARRAKNWDKALYENTFRKQLGITDAHLWTLIPESVRFHVGDDRRELQRTMVQTLMEFYQLDPESGTRPPEKKSYKDSDLAANYWVWGQNN